MQTRWWALAVVCAISVMPHAEAKGTKKSAATVKAEAEAKQNAEAEAAEAEAAAAAEAEAPEAEWSDSVPHVDGPKTVDLGHAAQIDLPAGFRLIEATEARRMAEEGGDDPANLVAYVFKPGASWMVAVSAIDDGYVTDEDADELDANGLIESIKQGTMQQNAIRRTKGVSELCVDGWMERPHYERAVHHLVWGLEAHDKDAKVINHDTRILGRNGWLSVTVIDSPETIAASRAEVQPVLAATHFLAGSRYEDHTSSDKSSGLSLKSLVIGVAGVAVAKKAGILVALMLGLKKLGIFIVAGVAGFFRWLTGKKKPVA